MFTVPDLRFAQTVVVGNVKGVSSGSCVHSTCASLLQPQVVEDLGETYVLQNNFGHNYSKMPLNFKTTDATFNLY